MYFGSDVHAEIYTLNNCRSAFFVLLSTWYHDNKNLWTSSSLVVQVIYSQQFEDTGKNGQEALDFFAKGIEKVYFTYFFNVALVIKGLDKLKEKGNLGECEYPKLADLKFLLAKAASLPNTNGIITETLKDYSAKFAS